MLDGSTALATQALHFNNTNWLTSALNFTAISGATTLRFSDTTGAVDPGTGFSTNWALATAAMLAVWALAAAFRFRRC